MALRPRILAVGIRLSLGLLAFTALGTLKAEAGQLQATWVDNSGGVAITRLERRLSTDVGYVAVADVAPGQSTYTDGSVTSGQTYCYRAFAYAATTASPYSGEVCATVASPPPTTNLSVTVSKAGTGAGLVTSSPSGINCDPVCAVNFAGGNSVTLAATPAAGSTFTGWSGGGCAGTSNCTLTGNAPVTVTATFAPNIVNTPPTPRDITAPQVTLSIPAPVQRKSRVTLNATISDDVGVARVDFYVNGIRVLCSISAAPYVCDWQVPNAANKTWVLQATATDAAGNVGRSQPIVVAPE